MFHARAPRGAEFSTGEHAGAGAECCKTRFDDCSDVSTHGDICVETPGLELFVPAAQMCHQHKQDQSGSDADVEQMNTRAPRVLNFLGYQSWKG